MLIHDKDQSVTKSYEKAPYPEELSGSWVRLTVLENHPILAGLSCAYFNDEYPSGTVVVSNYISDTYPDIYATWHEDGTTSRLFVSPKLRNSGKGRAALIVGDQLVNRFFNRELQYGYGQHKNGDFIVNGTYVLDKKIENRAVDDSTMFDFRDAAFPVIHFDKRFIRYEE
jgi:hypothetical protein